MKFDDLQLKSMEIGELDVQEIFHSRDGFPSDDFIEFSRSSRLSCGLVMQALKCCSKIFIFRISGVDQNEALKYCKFIKIL